MRILYFLDQNSAAFLLASLALSVLFGVVNWLYDPYRKQNKRMRTCTSALRAYPARASLHVTRLTEDYRRQWRAFVNSGTDKPAHVFEFVPKRKRVIALWMIVTASIVTTAYVAVFVMVARNFLYLTAQVIYWLAFLLIFFADKAIYRKQTRRAKQFFAQFVAQLTRVTPPKPSAVVEDTVSALHKLNRGEVTDETIGRASELLQKKGLDEHRTVEQQRQINVALNGLLQAYARSGQSR